MKIFFLMCLSAASLFTYTSTYAQDYEQGSGIAGCQAGTGVCNGWQWQPPYNQQGQAQQQNQAASSQSHWQSRWGAIATDGKLGVLGVSHNVAKQRDASAQAMADCKAKGGTECKLQTTYANGCAAMAVGKTGFAVASDTTREKASKVAIDTCSTGSDICTIYFSDCSPPGIGR